MPAHFYRIQEIFNEVSKTHRKIVVMGTTAFDLSVDERISMTGKELVQKIIEPNGINIVF